MKTKAQTKKTVKKAVKKSSKKSAAKKEVVKKADEASKGTVVAAPVPSTGKFEFDTPARLKKLADFVNLMIKDNLESNHVDYIGALVEIKHALYELAAYKETGGQK